MSNLQQESIKSILWILHSVNLTVVSFVTTALIMEECRNDPLLTSFLNGGVENLLESLLQMDLTGPMVSLQFAKFSVT
jgi:hypothetical protein